MLVRVFVDYSDTRFSNFAIEYLREIEKFPETVSACSYGAQVKSFKPKKDWKSRDTVPLKSLFRKPMRKKSTVQYATNVSTRNGVYTLWLIIFGLGNGIKGMVWLWMSSVADD